VFHCLRDSELLDRIPTDGKKCRLVPKIEKLGGCAALKIMNKALSENPSFIAQKVSKTPDD
jgi:hypothetical protein